MRNSLPSFSTPKKSKFPSICSKLWKGNGLFSNRLISLKNIAAVEIFFGKPLVDLDAIQLGVAEHCMPDALKMERKLVGKVRDMMFMASSLVSFPKKPASFWFELNAKASSTRTWKWKR